MATRLLQIVESKQSRLEDEIAQLYEATFDGLFHYAMAIVREKELAEDAIQECFLRYFIARKEEQAILNGRAWLYRVLRNQLLDFRKRVSLKDVSIDAAVHCPDRGQSPEAQLRCAELSKGFLALLTARELECFNLRIQGLRYQEIAAVLRIRSGTVGVLLARALKKIQKAMSRERN